MRKTNRTVWGALALTLLAGCSKDSTGPSENVLTDAEVDSFVGIINNARDAADGAQLTADGKLSGVLACSFIGDIAVAGQYTGNTEGTQVDGDRTFTFRKCRQGADVTVFVINGSLREVLKETYDSTSLTYTYDFHLLGSLNWEVKDRSGVCDIDITLAYKNVNGVDTVYTVAGKICGQSADNDMLATT